MTMNNLPDSTTPESLAVELVRIWGQLDPVDEWRPVLDQAAAGLRRLAAVEAERDQLRQRVEALTDDALARVMVASEDELNAALKLEGKDPEDTARLSGQAIQIATLTHERDQLRAEVEALRADSALLDWMQRQSLDDFAVGLVVDAPHDGDFWCSPDTGGMYYGKTLREAMLAARKG